VERVPQLDSLKKYAVQWTEELLEEIKKKGSYTEADNGIKNRYRQKDVKEALEKMYRRHCCYCESVVGTSSYGRIEHLRPKSLPQFHQYSFDWDNLHWCCEVCNTGYKKAKWDFQYPIFDPSKDDVGSFVKINLVTGEYEAAENNRRAVTTIEHTGLNREALVSARRKIVIRFLKDYRVHQKCGNGEKFCEEWALLKEDVNFPGLYDELICSVKKRDWNLLPCEGTVVEKRNWNRRK